MLIVPAFVPSPLGEIVEYQPSWHETLVCFGIWAFGFLLYTVFVRVAVPILSGELTDPEARPQEQELSCQEDAASAVCADPAS